EIFVGALQDHDRATIIGTTTFGKGSVNIMRRLSNGGGLSLTFAHWFTPNGRLIQDTGLEPDIQVDAVDPRDADVQQLQKAQEVLGELIQASVSGSATNS
ncbi:MAG: S41 family peptidase, partial [Ardenticatenaceae bacterium]